MAKFKNILHLIKAKENNNNIDNNNIDNNNIDNNNIDIRLSREDIFKICKIQPRDKIFNYEIRYISNWIGTYLKYHIPRIKVLLYGEVIYITDSSNVIYDNRYVRHPSSSTYKHKFDFEIKRLGETNFKNYKNCGISNTFIPECGAYIVTTEEGEQYIGSSINMRARLRQHVSLSNNKELQRFRDTIKIRSPIKLITIYECSSIERAKYLEGKLIYELHPRLN